MDHLLHSAWFGYYAWTAAFVTFYSCIGLRTSLGPLANLIGSLIMAVALGWLIWPFALFAGIRDRRARR